MNPCACGCGEMVNKRVKRGHWGRLPEARAMYEDPEHRRKLADGRRAIGNEKLRGRPQTPEHRAAIAAGRAASGYVPRRGFAARTLPCADCGQVWTKGLSRHEYDHHHGYGSAHHGCAQVVCSRCHHAREKARGNVRKRRAA